MMGSIMLAATAQPLRRIGGAGSGPYGSTLNQRASPDMPTAAASAPVPPLPGVVIAFQWFIETRMPPSTSGSPESRCAGRKAAPAMSEVIGFVAQVWLRRSWAVRLNSAVGNPRNPVEDPEK